MSVKALRLLAIFLVLLAALGLVGLYLNYMLSHGLGFRKFDLEIFGFKFPMPFVIFPAIGMVVVIMASWSFIMERLIPKAGRVEPLRLVWASATIMTAFTAILYIPYILGSSWFWGIVSSVSKAIPQISQPANSFLNGIGGFMILGSIWKYAISLNISAAALALASYIMAGRRRRARRAR